MKILLASLLLLPAASEVPDTSIPQGTAICNMDHTHCLVNYDDWAAWYRMAEENKELKQQVKTVKCASVTVLEPSKGY